MDDSVLPFQYSGLEALPSRSVRAQVSQAIRTAPPTFDIEASIELLARLFG